MTCLKFGLRPLLIIWITAALFSNKKSWLRVTCWKCWADRCQIVRKWMRRSDSFAGVTLKVSLGWLTGFCFQDSPQVEEPCIPSTRKPASSEIISDSALLWETPVCWSHIHAMGTNVCDPSTHSKYPDVDFESSKSYASEASWNKPNLQSSICFDTRPNCL